MALNDLTAERLRHIVHYDPESGVMTWRIPRKKCTVGARVGLPERRGYWVAKIDYQRYYLHRLIWLYMTGEWPTDDIDHIDRDKSNNRWSNLRHVTHKQNSENVGITKGNRSGVKGVAWTPVHKCWRARIGHHKKQITLGYFRTMEAAIEARMKAERELFTHAPPPA